MKDHINETIEKALEVARDYGQIDGAHHRAWVIDQMVRALCGSEANYDKWVAEYEKPLEDGDYCAWDCGIAP